MPTYDYRCNDCGHRFEQYQSIKDEPLKLCPSCGQEHAQRLISAGGGILFRGGGFYETDYRSASYKEAAKADKPAESKPAADTKSADSKSATSAAPAAPTSSSSGSSTSGTTGTA
jgi:putative FmdB family regulatory protein